MNQRTGGVVVVGAGPAGLFLAAELSRLGLDVTLLERRPDAVPGTRAIGVHPPTLAALEASGATEQILAEAARVPRGVAYAGGRVLGEARFDRLGLRFPFVAAVPQAVTEQAVATGAPTPLRGVSAVAIRDAGDHVVVTTRGAAGDGELRAPAVVVAAGSAGRGLLGVEFGARTHERFDQYLMADIASAPTQPRDTAIINLDRDGVLESFPLPGAGRRVVAWVGRGTGASGEAEVAGQEATRLRHAIEARTNDAELAAQVEHAQAFGIRHVLLKRMRRGRVFAIGDTAHEISPIGGQGMNLGLLDAATLAPPLAAWLRDEYTDAVLEAWERRRLASARTAARLSVLNTALGRPRSPVADAVLPRAMGVAFSGSLARLAAHAYAMGFDRYAKDRDAKDRDATDRDATAPRSAPS